MKHTRFAEESAAQAQAEAQEKQQHTPGPWDVQKYRTHTGFSIWAGERGCIAERWYDSEQSPPYGSEIEANARLIAAAPELLEALRKLVAMVRDSRVDDGSTWTENDGSAFAAAEQAIAKAIGK